MFCREALSRNPRLRERIQIIQIRGCLLPSVWRFCSALVNLQILGSLGSALCSDNTTRRTWVTASATQQVLSVPCALSWQGCRDSGAFVLVLGWLRRSRGVVAGAAVLLGTGNRSREGAGLCLLGQSPAGWTASLWSSILSVHSESG